MVFIHVNFHKKDFTDFWFPEKTVKQIGDKLVLYPVCERCGFELLFDNSWESEDVVDSFYCKNCIRCYRCGKWMVTKNVSFDFHDVHLGNFLADCCDDCNEVLFYESSSREIERIAKQIGVWGCGKGILRSV